MHQLPFLMLTSFARIAASPEPLTVLSPANSARHRRLEGAAAGWIPTSPCLACAELLVDGIAGETSNLDLFGCMQ